MTYYTIRHMTRYRYSSPIRENVMEVRMQPRAESRQRCYEFNLSVTPRAEINSFQDYLGNIVHHFDIPRQHVQLTLTAEALVEVQPFEPLPESLDPAAWNAVADLDDEGRYWEMLRPSYYARSTPALQALAEEFGLNREADPLTTLRRLNEVIYDSFAYEPQTTRVDSPIDEAIAVRRGVCQDFTHIMIALVRRLGIPCRYVSGYLFQQKDDQNRSAEDASHAWVEAFLPELGWVGFDPTNNLIAADRHIRVAVGRDYADVPPTRGVFKGQAEDELSVGVRVALADAPPQPEETLLPDMEGESAPEEEEEDMAWQRQQQQQQQQQ